MSEVDALRSTEYMANETEYLPWMPTLRGRTGYYKSMFYGTPSFDQLAVNVVCYQTFCFICCLQQYQHEGD